MIKGEKGNLSTSSILGSKVHLEGVERQREMDFMGLIENLKTREIERKVREDKAAQKKKSTAFKVTPTFFNDDEELSLLVKNVRRIFHKRGKFNNRKRRC